ncbi:MAG TPA: hypothetical protein VGK73_25595 [Polyangiaceae bacterium]
MTPRVVWAAAVAVAAVLLGLLLGLTPVGRSRVIGPLRTFALAAALTVVLAHLLPEAFEELGAVAVLLVALVAAVPAWVRLVRGLSGPTGGGHGAHVGLAAGYAGLLVHHVGDGLGLGAYASLPGGPAEYLDVLLALAVHTVPLVAVFALAFRAVAGVRAAVVRSVGLAAASVAGVMLSSSVPAELTHELMAWIAAFVAGLLVHVMSHDLERDLPTDALSRTLDLLAGITGAAVGLLGDDPELRRLRGALAETLEADAAKVALPLFVAYLAVLAISRLRNRALDQWLAPFPGPAWALDGVLVGAALAGPGFAGLLFVGVTLAARLGARHAAAPREGRAVAVSSLLESAVPWILTGLVLGALIRAALPEAALAVLSRPVALALAAVVALPIWLPPAAAVMIAVALWERGLVPEAALAFALLAAQPRPAALAEIARRVGRSAALSRLLTAALVGVGVGSVNAFVTPRPLAMPGGVGPAAALLLLLACAAVAWKTGLRALFGAVFHSHDTASSASPADASVSAR